MRTARLRIRDFLTGLLGKIRKGDVIQIFSSNPKSNVNCQEQGLYLSSGVLFGI